MTDADARAWRRLVAAARKAAARETYSVDAFVRAGQAAMKAVFPDPAPGARLPFLALTGFARTWPALDAVGRIDNAVAVTLAADACAAALDAAEGRVARPPRAAEREAASAPRRLPYRDDSFDPDPKEDAA